jgi:hypothetical protein
MLEENGLKEHAIKMKNQNNKIKRNWKLKKVVDNLFMLVSYLLIIFIYYEYIVPFYPLPFTAFWRFASVIVTLIYLAMGVFAFFQLIKSVVNVFRKK